jgi:tetratricopeptide (TPR) repeat protein
MLNAQRTTESIFILTLQFFFFQNAMMWAPLCCLRDTTPKTPLGVSVYWLQHGLLEVEVKDAGLDQSSRIYELENLSSDVHGVIRRKGQERICPHDGRLGAAYVDCLSGQDNVGPSTIMLSYGWGNSIGDIVDALVDYCHRCNLDHKCTYVWICCLCNNQHRVAERKKLGEEISFEEFESIFGDRVQNIGHVVAIMAPWRQPVYVSRVWCIYELFTAYNNANCKVDIAMPPREKRDMVKSLNASGMEGIELLFETLSKTDISQAQASEPMDKKRIMEMVMAGTGFEVLNAEVNELLRNWVKDGVMEAVESRNLTQKNQDGTETSDTKKEDLARLCTNVGNLMFQYAEYDNSLKLQRRALELNTSVFGESHLNTAASHCNIGSALTAKGDYEDALHEYEKYHDILVFMLGEEHPSTAKSHFSKGLVLRKMNRISQSLNEHKRALEIQNKTLGKYHADTAESHNEMGGILKEFLSNDDQAMDHYEISLEIREKIYGDEHPDSAQSYHNVGVMLISQGDLSGGLEKLNKANQIKEKILGKDHPSSILTSTYIQEQTRTEEFIDNHKMNDRFGLDHMASVMSIMDDNSFGGDSSSKERFRFDRAASVMMGPR